MNPMKSSMPQQLTPELRLAVLQEAVRTASQLHYSAMDNATRTFEINNKANPSTLLELPEDKTDRLAMRIAKRYLDFVQGESENESSNETKV